jgi:hypothetical protein
MSALSREASLVQNPALGAVLVWRFACGYRESHPVAACSPLALAFLVLPLIMHADSFELLAATRSGLRGFADKFSQARDPRADMILAIHDRAASWRPASLEAIKIGIRARLVSVARPAAHVIPLSESKPSGVPESIRPLLKGAEKLGTWCSALSVFEVASTLKVVF